MFPARLVTVCVLALASAASPALAQGWGTIKGRVVYDGDPPKLAPKQVTRDQVACLKNGPIPDEKWVVHPENKGVRWVGVWLAVDKNGIADYRAVPPLHPSVAAIPADRREVVMDQPCCKFEPHLLILRHGQTFVGKNSSALDHNMNLSGIVGPSLNRLLKPGETLPTKDGWRPHPVPTQVSCNLHPWMTAHIICLSHPYFAVTDADGAFEIKNVPAGKFRLVGWQDGKGWVLGEKTLDRNGQTITIEADKTIELTLKIKE
jgi:Polysaccharide lyase family 4, domain II